MLKLILLVNNFFIHLYNFKSDGIVLFVLPNIFFIPSNNIINFCKSSPVLFNVSNLIKLVSSSFVFDA